MKSDKTANLISKKYSKYVIILETILWSTLVSDWRTKRWVILQYGSLNPKIYLSSKENKKKKQKEENNKNKEQNKNKNSKN